MPARGARHNAAIAVDENESRVIYVGTATAGVWKSTNDGDDWTDETGDLVTISPGPAVWYEKDLARG